MCLAKLRWPPRKIAEEMKIQGADFAHAMETNILLRAAYEAGVSQQSEGPNVIQKYGFLSQSN